MSLRLDFDDETLDHGSPWMGFGELCVPCNSRKSAKVQP